MRYALRLIANAPTCVEKSMRTPDAYAKTSIMADMSATLIATDPASLPVNYRCPDKPGRRGGGRGCCPWGTAWPGYVGVLDNASRWTNFRGGAQVLTGSAFR